MCLLLNSTFQWFKICFTFWKEHHNTSRIFLLFIIRYSSECVAAHQKQRLIHHLISNARLTVPYTESDSLGKLSEFSLWKDESSPVYRDQRKDGMGRTLIRAGHLPEGWVCQSDRSWLGRAISWLSSRLAFRKESRMYSSGSMVALGIVAFEVACTGMLYSLPLAVREILCGLRTNTRSLALRTATRSRSLLIAHTWYACVMRMTLLSREPR